MDIAVVRSWSDEVKVSPFADSGQVYRLDQIVGQHQVSTSSTKVSGFGILNVVDRLTQQYPPGLEVVIMESSTIRVVQARHTNLDDALLPESNRVQLIISQRTWHGRRVESRKKIQNVVGG